MTHYVTAEQMLISALLNNRDVLAAQSHGLVLDHLQGYKAEYQWLLRYLSTYGDQPTVEIFSYSFPDFVMTEHDNVRSAVDAVLSAYSRRRLTEGMNAAFSILGGEGDPHLAWNQVKESEPLLMARKPRCSVTDTSILDDWDRPVIGVEMPYPTLQRVTKGIRPGNLWYLAARPGQGKSAHLANFAQYAVLAGNRVRFFSLEMSEEETVARFHVCWAHHFGYTGITLNALRDRSVDRLIYKGFIGELEERLSACGGSLEVFTPADGPVSPAAVLAGASEYQLNVVDYVQLMKSDRGTAAIEDWRVAAQISNSLKEIGLSSKTGILAAAQINREGDTTGFIPPKLKNLAQTDALGQDADVVLTARSAEYDVATNFSIEKNRHGPSGTRFSTTFDPNHGSYVEVNYDAVESLVVEEEARR